MPFLALLGGTVFAMLMPQPVSAQQNNWTAPAWVIPPADLKQYFRAEYYKDKNALKSVNPGGDQVKQIKRIVQAFLSNLTQENRSNLPKQVVDKLLADLHQQLTSPAARQVGMEEVTALAPDVLTHPDDLVRYNMIAILAQLSTKQAQYVSGTEIPSVPYNPAYKILSSVVQNPNEFLGCRILAARGLRRICRDGENAPSSNEKSDIATALTTTLAANPSSPSDGVWWFRLRLIEALGAVDRIDNTATQPIVLEALMDVITDPNEVWLNRAVAAQCITQLPYNAATNIQLVTSEVVKLLADLSQEFNRAPTPEVREAFKFIYFAFRPAQQRQAKEKKWGLLYEVERQGLGTHAAYVKGAWSVVHPIVRPFMETASSAAPLPAISDAEIKNLTAWIEQNPPASRQIIPGGKEYPAAIADPKNARETTAR